MASEGYRYTGDVDGTGMRVAIACGRSNDPVTSGLPAGARRSRA